MGVTSFIKLISSPAAARARIEDSRPAPGPLTLTSTRFIPWSIALRAHASAVCCAAKGVDFREPVKVIPAFAQATVFPFKSVIVIIVLLKVAWICAIPSGTFLRSRLLPRKLILLSLLKVGSQVEDANLYTVYANKKCCSTKQFVRASRSYVLLL